MPSNYTSCLFLIQKITSFKEKNFFSKFENVKVI